MKTQTLKDKVYSFRETTYKDIRIVIVYKNYKLLGCFPGILEDFTDGIITIYDLISVKELKLKINNNVE